MLEVVSAGVFVGLGRIERTPCGGREKRLLLSVEGAGKVVMWLCKGGVRRHTQSRIHSTYAVSYAYGTPY